MTYDIIRFTKSRTTNKKIIMYSITKEEAQAWCGNRLTKSRFGHWFDGFAPHEDYGTRQKAMHPNYFVPLKQQ